MASSCSMHCLLRVAQTVCETLSGFFPEWSASRSTTLHSHAKPYHNDTPDHQDERSNHYHRPITRLTHDYQMEHFLKDNSSDQGHLNLSQQRAMPPHS